MEQLKAHRGNKAEHEASGVVRMSSGIIEEIENIEDLEKEHETRDLEDDFEEQVQVAAYFISKADYTYDDLCWLLAEKIIKRTYKMGTPLSIRDTNEKAEEINQKTIPYDELCWLIAELDIVIKKYFDK